MIKFLGLGLLLLIYITPVHCEESIVNWNNFFIAHSWMKGTAGVIYFENDLKSMPEKMCQDLKQEPWRLTMIDQESFEISRLKKIEMPPYSSVIELNKFNSIVDRASIALKKSCLKVNLAPVVDKGKRGYENNSIGQYSQSFAASMRKQGIVPTWKHFPGMANNKSAATYRDYSMWYKNKNGEGVIENQTYEDILHNMSFFKTNNYDVLMFSVAIYKNISKVPIILSDRIMNLAYITQPNSLYISDDLSELNLNEEKTIWLFKHFDLLLYTNPQDIIITSNILQRAYIKGIIKEEEITQKIKKQNLWRTNNNFIKLP